MNRFFTKAVSTLVLSLSVVAGSASAQTGNGQNGNGQNGQQNGQNGNGQANVDYRLNFTGSANLMNQPGSAGANLLIDFLFGNPPNIAGTPTGTVRAVPTIGGGFMPNIMSGTTGSIQDLVFSSTAALGSSTVTGLPVNPFLQIGGYSFTLDAAPTGNTFGPVSLFAVGGTGTLASFSVTGRVNGNGLTDNAYQGVFTAQFADLTPSQVFERINSGGTLPVSFSAEFAAASVVPEPSTYVLMASGIGMLGLMARRRQLQNG